MPRRAGPSTFGLTFFTFLRQAPPAVARYLLKEDDAVIPSSFPFSKFKGNQIRNLTFQKNFAFMAKIVLLQIQAQATACFLTCGGHALSFSSSPLRVCG